MSHVRWLKSAQRQYTRITGIMENPKCGAYPS